MVFHYIQPNQVIQERFPYDICAFQSSTEHNAAWITAIWQHKEERKHNEKSCLIWEKQANEGAFSPLITDQFIWLVIPVMKPTYILHQSIHSHSLLEGKNNIMLSNVFHVLFGVHE